MEISIESLMWVKQCHWKTTHDWEWNFHITYYIKNKKNVMPADGLWHCFTNIIWYLIGGFNPSEKYEFVRLVHHPNYWGEKKLQATNQICICIYIFMYIHIHPGANRIWTCQTRSLKWRYHWQCPSLLQTSTSSKLDKNWARTRRLRLGRSVGYSQSI